MKTLLRHIIRGIIIEHLFIFRNRARRALTDLLFNHPRSRTTTHNSSTGKVLFLRLDGKYGDSLISQFLYKTIKDKLNAEIYMLSKNRESIEFFSEEIDHYILCHNPRRAWHLYKAYSAIRSIHFDYVIYLGKQTKDRELVLLRQINTNCLIVADKRIQFADKYLLNSSPTHYKERCKNLLRELGIPNKRTDTSSINIPDNEKEKIRSLLYGHTKIIYFNPYGSGSQRKLSNQRVSEITHLISQSIPDHTIIIQSKIHSELSLSKEGPSTYIFTTNNFNDILTLVSLSKLIITVDTATSHAATVFNKSSIVFYNPDPENYTEWNANSIKSTPIFSSPVPSEPPNSGNFDNQDLLKSIISYKNSHTPQ